MESKKAIHTGVKFNGIKGGYYCMIISFIMKFYIFKMNSVFNMKLNTFER